MMNVDYKIAWRYFFSKSNQTVINRISNLAVFVILIATCSLLIVLSAFSGLKDFGLSFSNVFDPDFRILPNKGKVIYVDSLSMEKLKAIPEIIDITPIIEEKVFLSFEGKSHVAFMKGVDENFDSVIPIDSILSIGEWVTPESSSVVIGYGIANTLGASVYDYSSFLKITAPKASSGSIINRRPFKSFPSSVVGLYQVSEDIDKKYIFTNLSLAKDLFEFNPNTFSYLEINSHNSSDKNILQKKIQKILSSDIKIKSRSEINVAIQKMMKTENLAVYLIFTLILIIALFNLSGALLIIILDKKKQLKILSAIGLQKLAYRKIFFYVGCLITFVGGMSGIIIGSLIILLQKNFRFVKVPGTDLAYPVVLEAENLIVVFLTLAFFGSIASFLTVNNIRFVDKSFES
tara:strand:- start:45 stop:1256 length:1212 start_codon:yes stop_codon:yes gene_type:complete